MKYIIVTALLMINLVGFSQDGITCQNLRKPNKVYKTSSKNSQESTMRGTGNVYLKSFGSKKKSFSTFSCEKFTTSITGQSSQDGNIPVKIIFDKEITSSNDNGELKNTSLTGLIFEGFYENGLTLKINSLTSATMNKGSTDSIMSEYKNVTSVHQNVEFPVQPIKLGDTFTRESEISITQSETIKIITTYTLNNIDGNFAKFAFSQKAVLLNSDKAVKVSVSGEGLGTLDYDISNQVITKYDSELSLKVKFKFDDSVVDEVSKYMITEIVTVE